MFNKERICPICKAKFKSERSKPRVLGCGHTFCVTCISGFVEKLRKCFTCHKPIENLPSALPTNRAILNAEGVLDVVRFENGRLRMHIEDEQQQINKRLERMNQLSETISTYEHVYDRLDYSGGQNSRTFTSSLENINLMRYSCLKPKITPHIVLGSFSSKEGFFRYIMVELYRKKSIYACKSEWNQVEIYWGKLSYKARQLCIHCFTTERPPSSSLIVGFRDLEKCMNLDNFRTFIDIAADHIVCKMLSASEISWSFVKSCTGEDGVSFKGSNVEIEVFTRGGHKYTDVTIANKRIMPFENLINYKFLTSLPWITSEDLNDTLHIVMGERFCRIRKYHTLSNTEKVWDAVPIASGISFGHIFSSERTSERAFPDNYIIIKAIVKDCGILVLPIFKQKNTSTTEIK
ncbi:UNVERIFIED_CONTAM: hypothetical protein RMT77_006116 [Armadillidium vulgare]